MAETRLNPTDGSEPLEGAPVKCQLVVIEGPDMGRAVLLDAERTVGTHASADLRLTDDTVSERHLRVTPSGAGFAVRDAGSTNGTFFEGSRVTELVVKPGATLKIGASFLRVQPQPRALEVAASQARRFGELVAESLAMREVFAVLELAAASDVTVLVQGETGTGKELVARAIHDASARRGKPFVAIDCGALPESLLESELFGHVRGAFTGASSARTGAFARAQCGTLFLDELGAVQPSVQARLLRVIEERKVKPVGSDDERKLDVRLVAASRVDLATRVAEGAFRPDLYFRLSVLAVGLPPLRQRREDISLVVAELLRVRGFEAGKIEGPNLDLLKTHSWPGNVRELRNVIERAMALSPTARSFQELRVSLSSQANESDALAVRTDLPFKQAKEQLVASFEARYVRDLHARHQGNVSAAAREAQVDRKHWRGLLREHGVLDGPDED
jgi:transcriptional regulator with PAS, ATPase and Fis domain